MEFYTCEEFEELICELDDDETADFFQSIFS